MKNRTVFAFLAGFATCAAALYGAGNHTPAIYFALGALAASVAFAALGWAFNPPRRRYRVSRRELVTPRRRLVPAEPAEAAADSRRKCEPGTFKKPTAPASPIEADVISALKNWGTTSTEARELARQAIDTAGAGANFEQVIRLAVRRKA